MDTIKLDRAYTATIGNAVDLAFRLTATDFVPTVHMAPTDFDLGMVSSALAAALPALIGVSWDQGPLVVGAVRDCAGNQVSDVVVTVSRTDECPEHAAGAGTYYFNNQNLPVRRTVEPVATENGLYMVLVAMAEAPFTGQVQVWGFAAGADPATDPMVLLATRQVAGTAAGSATMIAVP